MANDFGCGNCVINKFLKSSDALDNNQGITYVLLLDKNVFINILINTAHKGGKGMSVYKCSVCGYEYDESAERIKFKDLPEDWVCPVCKVKKELVLPVPGKLEESKEANSSDAGDYAGAYAKTYSNKEAYMTDIHEMAATGRSIIEPMNTKLPIISWNDILIMGAQLNPAPLSEHAEVSLKTVIGKTAEKPMVIENPVYVSHMSFGALSKEVKIALAKGSAMAKTAMCSGEGGILPEEMQSAYKYIFEYVPNMYSVTSENLQNADAIEIKIGQGTKPGMGGHLPGEKVTEEIAQIRNKPVGKDIISPSTFEHIKTKEDLKKMVEDLRVCSKGRPIGIKIAASHIEKDMEWIAFAMPDFVTIDGRGGATGASPKSLKDASSIPTIFALYRAKKYITEKNLPIDLIITGGLRVPADFAKAIAMGADAVAIASSALIATACQQYRICNSGNCPVGIATQNPELRKRLNIDKSAQRLGNFLKVTADELATFTRVTGHDDIHKLSVADLYTVNSEISEHTNIEHV